MDNPFLKKNCFPASWFELSRSPFADIIPVLLKSTPYSPYPTFGFSFQDYDLLKISFVNINKPRYLPSNIFSNPISTNDNLRGYIVISIYYNRVFTSADALKQLRLLHEQGGGVVSITYICTGKYIITQRG